MKMMNAEDNKLVFGLDIGTRSIVGTVGYRIGTDRFVVVAQESIEHTTRAVIDGQIHDIPTVADTIYKVKERLEKRVREPLSDVSIAAAGRVLKTKRVKVRYQFNSETKVTEDHIRSLDMMGVEQAYDEIRKEQTDSGKKFFCVGYSIVKYYLNGYPMEMIEMQMANYIEVELSATFLPVSGFWKDFSFQLPSSWLAANLFKLRIDTGLSSPFLLHCNSQLCTQM